MKEFVYAAPRSRQEAASLFGGSRKALLLAGGTDLLVQLRAGRKIAIAQKLGIDGLDLRLKKAAKEGTRRADGPKINAGSRTTFATGWAAYDVAQDIVGNGAVNPRCEGGPFAGAVAYVEPRPSVMR